VKSSRTNIPFKHLHKPSPRQSHSAGLRLDRFRFLVPTEQIAKLTNARFTHSIQTHNSDPEKRQNTIEEHFFATFFSTESKTWRKI
jgi:hypothetical protein